MATEAQIAANRLNAQKSTGPRTPEGKAVAAHNAIKHGLLAREGLLRGEDAEEFERHREALLEQLNPAGPLEAILAARIVDLTWRLQRAAQDRNETFGALYDRHTAGAEEPGNAALLSGNDKKANPDRAPKRGRMRLGTQIGGPGAILGRMILEDYSGEAVLERLLRYERRIEGSFCRMLNELRRVHDQGRKADLEAASALERWREEDDRARKERAFAPWRAADGNPTSDLRPLSPEFSCETNPIGFASDLRQVQCGTTVMSDTAADGLGKTKPICDSSQSEAMASSAGVPPMNTEEVCLSKPTLRNKANFQRAEESVGPAPPYPWAQSCGTNPIPGWDGTGRGLRDGG